MPAHRLALDRAGDVGGKADAVVLVPLEQRAVAADAGEVDRHAEVRGREVGEPVGGVLVGDAEGIAEVLDREVLRLGAPCRNATAAVSGIRQHAAK